MSTPELSVSSPAPEAAPSGSAVSAAAIELLGEARATIVRLIVARGTATARELADELDITTVAVRKHLACLQEEGYITSETVKGEGPGRPAAAYSLSDKGRRELLPDRSADLVGEMLDFLEQTQGRSAVVAFHRWRRAREAELFDDVVTAEDLHERLQQLATALHQAGYQAAVGSDGETLQLTQTHCAIYDVAKDHPEMCAHETALFRDVLDADVSRRDTLANGAAACVCTVRPRKTTQQ